MLNIFGIPLRSNQVPVPLAALWPTLVLIVEFAKEVVCSSLHLFYRLVTDSLVQIPFTMACDA